MSFCTAINCMDGRVQLPVIQYLQKRFQAKYVDSITEPGPIHILAEQSDPQEIRAILERINISIEKHGSNQIALVGHHDCAGNPVSREVQLGQIKRSIAYLKSLYPNVEVIGLWVNERWDVEPV